jgi:predicted transcriptional regulator
MMSDEKYTFMKEDEFMKAININDKDSPFTDWILDGIKTVETREKNTLKSLVGQRVGIIRTGCGKAMLVGYITIAEIIKYGTENEFRLDTNRHMVKPGSKYDIRKDGVKYGYVLVDPKKCKPVTVDAKGIVIRNI